MLGGASCDADAQRRQAGQGNFYLPVHPVAETIARMTGRKILL